MLVDLWFYVSFLWIIMFLSSSKKITLKDTLQLHQLAQLLPLLLTDSNIPISLLLVIPEKLWIWYYLYHLYPFCLHTKVAYFCKGIREVHLWDYQPSWRFSFPCQFVIVINKRLCVEIYFVFNNSFMCLTSILEYLNPIESTNSLSSLNFYLTFSLSIPLDDLLWCSSNIIMYFYIIILLKILLLSVGTINSSLTSKIYRIILVFSSFIFFLVV